MSKRNKHVKYHRLKPGEIWTLTPWLDEIRVAGDVKCAPVFHHWGMLDIQPTDEIEDGEYKYGIITDDGGCCYEFNETDYEVKDA